MAQDKSANSKDLNLKRLQQASARDGKFVEKRAEEEDASSSRSSSDSFETDAQPAQITALPLQTEADASKLDAQSDQFEEIEADHTQSHDMSLARLTLPSIEASALPDGHFVWDNVKQWYFGVGHFLSITMSGRVDQACLDSPSGINGMTWKFLFVTFRAREQAWDSVNDALKTAFDSHANFTFLPCIDRTDTRFSGTVELSVPTLIASGRQLRSPTLTVDVGTYNTVKISGQIIYATGFIHNSINSGTLIIDRACSLSGDFYISANGKLHFTGKEADTAFTAADRSVVREDVLYDNANVGGKTLWAMVLNGLTVTDWERVDRTLIRLDGGEIASDSSAIIVMNFHGKFIMESESTIRGNLLIGWDDNIVDLRASFIMAEDAKFVISSEVDFKNIGFSGAGTVVVCGKYWSGSAWKVSAVKISDGAKIGNLAIGYNPFYDQGIGGASTAFGDKEHTNDQPRFGASATLTGSIKLSGIISIGGGESAACKVTITESAKISRLDDSQSGGIDVVNKFGSLDIKNSVVLDVSLEVHDGIVNGRASVSFSDVFLYGGRLVCDDGDSFKTLTVSGGYLEGGKIHVTGKTTVSAGTLSAQLLTCDDSLNVIGSGKVKLSGGSLKDLTINSSADSDISASFTLLKLGAQNTGKTALNGTSFSIINVQGGTLKFTAVTAAIQSLTVSGGIASSDHDMVVSILAVSGGAYKLYALTVKDNFTVNGGLVSSETINYTADKLIISDSGAVKFSSGTLNIISIESSADSLFGCHIANLTLEKGDTGTASLKGNSVDTINQMGGVIIVIDTVTVGSLDLSGGITRIGSSSELKLNGTSLTVRKEATLKLDGGTLTLSQASTYNFNGKFEVTRNGGQIHLENASAEFNIVNGMSIEGALDITGKGVAKIYGDVKGSAEGDVIHVKSGATLMVMKDAKILPKIYAESGGQVTFEDNLIATATIVCSDDASRSGSILHLLHNVSDELVTHVNVTIENFQNGVRLDLDALKEKGATFKKAYYADGKVHVLYEVLNPTSSIVEQHEIILEHVSGKNLYENENLNACILPDGNMTWSNELIWVSTFGILNVGLTGRIDQTCLDSSSGVNQKAFGWGILGTTAKHEGWAMINQIMGTHIDPNTRFTFLPCIDRLEVNFTENCDVLVPVLVTTSAKSYNSKDYPIINIDVGAGNIVNVSGQIIIGSGIFSIKVNSGTFSVAHAYTSQGFFTIEEGGTYHFSGAAPDVSANATGFSVKASDVVYDNGNATGLKFWAQVVNDSIFTTGLGSVVETEASGVIVFNSRVHLSIFSTSLSGNYVLSWDNNALIVVGNFVLARGAKFVASGNVKFSSGWGFSGEGSFVLSGNYWDGKSWQVSSADIADKSIIGNLTIGYNPFYDQGIGSAKTILGDSRVNAQPRYGALAKISGIVELTGLLAIGGGESISGEVKVATDASVEADTTKHGVIEIVNNLGVLKLADSVTLNVPLIVDDGTVTCDTGDHLKSLTINGGTFKATSGTSYATELSIDQFVQNGGTFNASWLKISGDASISAGSFGAETLQCGGALKISGKGAAQIDSGDLGDVTISSTSDNIIGASFTTLALTAGNSGVTTLTGAYLTTITVKAGTLKFTAKKPTVTRLTVNGGTVSGSNTITISTLEVTGGSLNFDSLIIKKKLTVSGGALTVKTITYTNDVLAISGAGKVDLAGGTLGLVTVNSSADSSFGADMSGLTLQTGNSGTVSLTGGTLDKLTQQAGTLKVTDRVTIKALDLTGGTTEISGTLNFDGTTFSVGSNVTVKLDGGKLLLKQAATFHPQGNWEVTSKGGTIDFGTSSAELTFGKGLKLGGALTVSGKGVVKLTSDVEGDADKGVIHLKSGVTLVVSKNITIAPEIQLDSEAQVSFEDGSSSTATVTVSDEAAKAGCSINFKGELSSDQVVTHIKVRIKNFGDGVKLDVEGLKQRGMTIKRAYYEAGKIHILYEIASASSNARSSGLHELIFDHVSGKNLKDGQDLTVNPDGHGGTEIETCFLSGTRIRTAEGWRLVEDLVPGDLVMTYENGAEVASSVRWVGFGDVTCRLDVADDLAGYAVRIVKDAFGPGAPFEDVLVTSEHCVFVDGGLIPVRMLVNGGSIVYERDLPRYRFYHIETEKHAIVSAAGLQMETYLDTGNRARFSAGRGVVGLRPKTLSELAAPLYVTRGQVEPVSARLAGRDVCRERLLTLPEGAQAGACVTMDAGLHLLLPDGGAIWPVSHREGGYVFNLPKGVDAVRLVSRASRPCDVIGPYVDDRRMLGVLVGAVHLIGPQHMIELTHHFTEDVPGWHSVESPAARWTNGCAVLKLPDQSTQLCASMLLHIKILTCGPYLTASEKTAVGVEAVAA